MEVKPYFLPTANLTQEAKTETETEIEIKEEEGEALPERTNQERGRAG
jgi:hypothetical protein